MNLAETLKQHEIWLKSKGKKGNRANFKDAYLVGAYLVGANLQRANLQRADLKEANFKDAYLKDADLAGAYCPEGLKGYEIDEEGYII